MLKRTYRKVTVGVFIVMILSFLLGFLIRFVDQQSWSVIWFIGLIFLTTLSLMLLLAKIYKS